MSMRNWIPLVFFLVLVVFLGIGLGLNPKEVPSPLIGKKAPDFNLAQLHQPNQTFSPEQMLGKVWLFNVWASWCVSCREEHRVLNDFNQLQIAPIVGLNYKDEPLDAINWLNKLGNPYLLSVSDSAGKAGLDFGVYGVPETFLIDKKGIIRHKHIGPVTVKALQEEIMPLIAQLNQEVN